MHLQKRGRNFSLLATQRRRRSAADPLRPADFVNPSRRPAVNYAVHGNHADVGIRRLRREIQHAALRRNRRDVGVAHGVDRAESGDEIVPHPASVER
ncbi:hypothetical protein MIMGU_mgv1a017034mg [Erythranthe guttata]|uniref:Uncharacterized protein n=1 Tax=Erythranthe guttata TaxID=4155 RepID=A0A022QPD2_ERYGU|nr:hypothetical protein MIMGU_mgv1a017034mg [Erythranthe guttata]